ncbi:MAG TPA: tetratricopeptide repeat protein [Candidatus Polarisedimenticolia bacterium]|jgi:tetratricopeptide (TPR) repeat protein
MVTSSSKLRYAALAAALLAALLYANTLPGPFLNDDIPEIQENPRVHSLAGIPSLLVTGFWAGASERSALYRPLIAIADTLLFLAGGGGPAPFHAFNVLVHAANSALVVILAFALGFPLPASLLAGLLFAAHPVHTEAVSWISGGAELAASFFLLLAWIAHRRGRLGAASAAFALAVLSKEMAVVFPALALAGDWLRPANPAAPPGARSPRSWRAAIFAYGGIALGYLALRFAVLGHFLGGGAQAFGAELLNPLVGEPALTRVLTSLRVLLVALRQTCMPLALCFNYGFDQIPIARSIAEAGVLGGGAILAAGLAVIGLAGGRRGALGLGAAIFLIAFLPASNLLFPGITIFAERNLYFPVLGICLMAASLLAPARWRWTLAAVLLVAMGTRTVIRNGDFLSSLTLYEAATVSCPASAGAWSWYGIALKQSGRLDEAVAAQRRALAIAPRFADAHAELGLAHLVRGEPAPAEEELSEALRLRPGDWRARSNLALIYANTGRLEAAIDAYELAAREQPENLDLQSSYAAALIESGREEEARAIFERIEREVPGSAVGPNGLGALAARQERWDEAATLFAEAVRRDPRNVNAVYNHAQALARTGRRAEAIAALESALLEGVADDGIIGLLSALRAGEAAER